MEGGTTEVYLGKRVREVEPLGTLENGLVIRGLLLVVKQNCLLLGTHNTGVISPSQGDRPGTGHGDSPVRPVRACGVLAWWKGCGLVAGPIDLVRQRPRTACGNMDTRGHAPLMRAENAVGGWPSRAAFHRAGREAVGVALSPGRSALGRSTFLMTSCDRAPFLALQETPCPAIMPVGVACGLTSVLTARRRTREGRPWLSKGLRTEGRLRTDGTMRGPAWSRGGTPGEAPPCPRRHHTAVTVGMHGVGRHWEIKVGRATGREARGSATASAPSPYGGNGRDARPVSEQGINQGAWV